MTSERWCRLKPLYNHTLEIPSADRENFIASLGRRDPDSATELRFLLATDSSGDLLNQSLSKRFLPASEHVFAPGQRLCERFEIIQFIASGGMGEVYEAYDRELRESVALKTVRAEIGTDSLSADLFRNEVRRARAITSPYVCRVHDLFIHRSAGQRAVVFLSMQLLRGETLTERLGRDQRLSTSEALLLLRQIAEGLDAAHRVGIVHGDLKSGNIMLTRDQDGVIYACITDFGLARRAPRLPEEGAALPDIPLRAGTPAWMAPEQLESGITGPEADIYALGLIAYEMVTGRLPFDGRTLSEVSYNRLVEPPKPARAFSPDLSQAWDSALSQCLAKDPLQRFRTGAEVVAAISSGAQARRESTRPRFLGGEKSKNRQRIGLSLLIILAAFSAAAFWFLHGAADLPLQVVPLTAYPGEEREPAFSPDGKTVAFSWDGEKGGNTDIYLKSLGPGKPVRLTTNAEPDINPVWSPDGRWIAFMRHRANIKWTILVIPAQGGPERTIAELDNDFPGLGGWSPDSHWLVVSGGNTTAPSIVLYLVSVENGERRQLTFHPGRASTFDYVPAFAPNGRMIAFVRSFSPTAIPEPPVGDLYVIELTSDFSTSGQPRRLTFDNARIGGIAWTSDSRELIFSSHRGGSQALWRIGIAGSTKPSRLPVGDNALFPSISRMGKRLAYSETIPIDTNVWRLNLSAPGQGPIALISSTRADVGPQYSPDGRRIAFQSERSGKNEVWICNADGSDAEQLTDLPYAGSPRWSPDGTQVAFDAHVEGHWQIYTIPASGGQPLRRTSNPFNDIRPSWSHDGKWIYFASNRFGPYSLWKLPVLGGETVQLTKDLDDTQFESPDGKSLYYIKTERSGNNLWKLELDAGKATRILGPVSNQSFAITPTGVYYVNLEGLQFYSFATRKSRLVLKPLKPIVRVMSVSPDGSWLLYGQVDQPGGSDLMLIENFR